MKVKGFDHLVLKTADPAALAEFYGDVLGMEILRLDQFRKGEVGFVSVRINRESIIDIQAASVVDREAHNLDHFTLVLEPTDMEKVRADLVARGLEVEEQVRPAFGAQGMGDQFKFQDPQGNKIELRCYQ